MRACSRVMGSEDLEDNFAASSVMFSSLSSLPASHEAVQCECSVTVQGRTGGPHEACADWLILGGEGRACGCAGRPSGGALGLRTVCCLTGCRFISAGLIFNASRRCVVRYDDRPFDGNYVGRAEKRSSLASRYVIHRTHQCRGKLRETNGSSDCN